MTHLGVYFLIGLVSIAYNVSSLTINSKIGARLLVNVARPQEASKIISCTAARVFRDYNTIIKKELSELAESGKTQGHFIATDSCSFELMTTVDFGTWEITTHYFDQQNRLQKRLESVTISSPDYYVSDESNITTFYASADSYNLIRIPEPEKGKVLGCEATYELPKSVIKYNSASMKTFDDFYQMPVFEKKEFENSCTMRLYIDREMFGKWTIITLYKYVDDSERDIRTSKSDTVMIKDINVLGSFERSERVVSPDFEFTVKQGTTQTIEAVVGKSRTMTPSPIDAKYIERCEAVYVGKKEDFVFEISPVKDTRFEFNKRNVYSTCEFEFIRFQRSYYGKWILSSYFKKVVDSDRRGKMFRQDDYIIVNEPARGSKSTTEGPVFVY